MRNIAELDTWFIQFTDKLPEKLAEAQHAVAEDLCNRIKKDAPVRTGTYQSSIKTGPTEMKDGKISTEIYTDLLIGGNDEKWKDVPLGALLEWGTGLRGQATGRANAYGYTYRQTPWTYFDEERQQWVTTIGMVARPHFYTNLMSCKRKYKWMIRKAMFRAWLERR